MLKRTVAATAAAMVPVDDRHPTDIGIYGIDLELDESILNAIAVAQEQRDAAAEVIDEDEVELGSSDKNSTIYWAPLLHTVLWVY